MRESTAVDGLSYETLTKEVSDSITWRRFYRIPLDRPAPHPTTILKVVRRCGTETIVSCPIQIVFAGPHRRKQLQLLM